MAHEFPDIPFTRHGPVDEAFAYEHADVIHGALEKITDLQDTLPAWPLRLFKRDVVGEVDQKIRHAAVKAGREFDERERVVGENRHESRMLRAFFDYFPELDDVSAEQYKELTHEEHEYSMRTRLEVRRAYGREQSAKLQTVRFDLFDSLSPEPQPTSKSVLSVLDALHLYPVVINGQLSRNREYASSDEAETHATVFPKLHVPGGSHASGWDYPDQDLDQHQRSLTVHYSQSGPDVAVSVVVAIQPHNPAE
jgi:DNA-binding phage protein